MAVTNMWPIKGKVSTLVNYIENPEKTSAQNVKNVLSYIEDDNKTEKMLYVTGINCEPAIAAKQFTQTKQLWGKEGGRVAYHGYQSFREGEVDAETAHRIGVELARRLWGDRFEVVVATHLNTGHYHNHFCLNSVSFADGYKYHDTKEDKGRSSRRRERPKLASGKYDPQCSTWSIGDYFWLKNNEKSRIYY